MIKNDEDAIYDLLSDGIEEFRQLGEVYLPDEFRHLRILHKPKVSVGVNTMGDWLELNIDMGELEQHRYSKDPGGVPSEESLLPFEIR